MEKRSSQKKQDLGWNIFLWAERDSKQGEQLDQRCRCESPPIAFRASLLLQFSKKQAKHGLLIRPLSLACHRIQSNSLKKNISSLLGHMSTKFTLTESPSPTVHRDLYDSFRSLTLPLFLNSAHLCLVTSFSGRFFPSVG